MLHRISAANVDLLARVTGEPDGAQDFVQEPGAIAVVAERDDEVLGWCWGHLLLRPGGGSMLYLHHLQVTDRHRRGGVGRALVREFMDAGRERGATRMFHARSDGEPSVSAREGRPHMTATDPKVRRHTVLPATPTSSGS